MAQKGLRVLQIVHFLFTMPSPVVYQPHPLHRQVLIQWLHMLKLSVEKGRQVMKQLSEVEYCNTTYATVLVAIEHAGYVLFRALVLC